MSELRPKFVASAAKSDPGRDPEKQVNEDAYGITAIDGSLLAVVCDGMGGHVGGRLASHTAVDVIQKVLATAGPAPATRTRLHQAIVEASAAVHRVGGDASINERPGATCVSVWLHADTLDVAHVGDSRCYRWRLGTMEPLTRDHSVIEAWIQAGHVTRDQAHLHPDAHRITRALGIEPTVDVELRPAEPLVPGDKFLLCSDGLTDLVTELEIANILGRSNALDQLADELVALANLRGGHDNVTALLLEVTDSAPVGFDPTGQNASPSCYVLSTPAVPTVSTERIDLQDIDPDRTLPLGPSDRTILMDERPAVHLNGRTRSEPTASRNLGKTQPLFPMEAMGTLQHRPFTLGPPKSPIMGGRGRRRLWVVFGVTLLLIGFAIAFGLIRR